MDPVEALTAESRALARADAVAPAGGRRPRPVWLQLWESPFPCVVLPRHGAADEWVYPDACRRLGVPVLRRQSGGGAVVLGPGCLVVSIVLPIEEYPGLRDVAWSYDWLLRATTACLSVDAVESRGSDLMLAGRKFAGHAQRRTRDALLHHGTLLYRADLSIIETVLREPRRRPAHRGERRHRDFLTNLPLPGHEICARLRRLPRRLGARAAPPTRGRHVPIPARSGGA